MGATWYTFDWAENLWKTHVESGKAIPAGDLRKMLEVYRATAIQRGRALESMAFDDDAADRARKLIENSPEVVLRNGQTLYRLGHDSDETEDI